MAGADVATVKTKPTATNLIMASSNHVNLQEEIFTTRGRLAQFLRALNAATANHRQNAP